LGYENEMEFINQSIFYFYREKIKEQMEIAGKFSAEEAKAEDKDFEFEISDQTLKMIDESIRNADEGVVGETFNPDEFKDEPVYEYLWQIDDGNGTWTPDRYYTEMEIETVYPTVGWKSKIEVSKRKKSLAHVKPTIREAKVPEPDAEEAYEWKWELDSGTDYWVTGLYFTEDEIQVQAADVPHKCKLEHTKRRRK